MSKRAAHALQRRHLALGGAAAWVLPAAWSAPPTPPNASAPLVVTLRAPDTASDRRRDYARDAIQLALERTAATYGPYRLVDSSPMNKRRALLSAQANEPANFLITASPAATQGLGLAVVPFPVYLGINGYRVCFAPRERLPELARIRNLDDMARFRHVQGREWPDVAVLRANGQQVIEAPNYETMFEMVALNRADLFCRSLHEIAAEAAAHAHLSDLAIEPHLLLHYELPQYLHTHPSNRVLIERVTRGLERCYADGSLQALLRRHLKPAIDQLQVAKRQVLELKPPPGWQPPPGPQHRLDIR
ncbi:hypothetical protein [Roseateles paludis]|jgi:hypothetical protein|uniref:Solute-binding protein family 3/N-terminal domain-containing protein n=1 Tax=Roseateles paludis TaxID=3145238 RepID=A0ABV0G0E1_9BURK